MDKIIDAEVFERQVRRVVDEVAQNGIRYIVARDNRPAAAVVSYEALLRLQTLEQREREFREHWRQMRAEMAASSAGYSEEEVAAEVEAARQEVWEAREGLGR